MGNDIPTDIGRPDVRDSNLPAQPGDNDSTSFNSFTELARKQAAEANTQPSVDSSAAALFRDSFAYEGNRSLRGVAQLVGMENNVPIVAEPTEAKDWVGEHSQMAGRAIAGLLPTLGAAALTRFGFGKMLGRTAETTENILLKRSAIGLSATESGVTGFLVGSLLTPTDQTMSTTGLLADRMKSGVSSAASYGFMTASSLGFSRLASTELAASMRVQGLMRVSAVNGIVSGFPGGIANVELDSLVHQNKLNYDGQQIGKSIYEMSLFGGVFGAGTSALSRIHTSREVGSSFTASEQSVSQKTATNLSDALVPTAGDKLNSLLFERPRAYWENGTYDPLRTTAVRHLNEFYGGDSDTMALMLRHERLQSNTESLSNIAAFIAKNPTRRVGLVREAVQSEMPEGLVRRLESYEKLGNLLGNGSDAAFALQKTPWAINHDFESLNKFIEESPEKRLPMINKMVGMGATPYDLSVVRFADIEKLHEIFGADSPTMKRISWLDNSKDRVISNVADFLPQKLHDSTAAATAAVKLEDRKALIEKLVSDGATNKELDFDRLTSFEKLRAVVPEDSLMFRRILQLEKDSLKSPLPALAEFIEANPKNNISLVDRLLQNPAAGDFSAGRLQAFDYLSTHFDLNSPTMKRLLDLERSDEKMALTKFATLVKDDPTVVGPLLEKLTREVAPNHEFLPERLHAVEKLKEYFGAESDEVKQLLSIEARNSGQARISLDALSEFIGENPNRRVPTIRKLLAEGDAKPGDFDEQRLKSFDAVQVLLSKFPDDVSNIRKLEKQNKIDLDDLVVFWAKHSDDGVATVREISRTTPNRKVGEHDFENVLQLRKYFGNNSPVTSYLVENAFSISEVNRYMKNQGWFTNRKQLVEDLVANNAAARLFLHDTLAATQKLFETLSPKSATGQKLLGMVSSPQFDPESFAAVVSRKPALVKKAVDAGAGPEQLRETTLVSIDRLRTHIGKAELSTLLELGRQGLDLSALERQSLSNREAMIKELVRRPSDTLSLNIDSANHDELLSYPKAIKSFKEIYNDDALTAKFTNSLMYHYLDLASANDLVKFLREDPSARRVLLDQALEDNPTTGEISPARLRTIDQLNRNFGVDSPAVQYLLQINRNHAGTDYLDNINNFVKQDPIKNADMVRSLIDEQAERPFLDSKRLETVKDLYFIFGEQSETTKRLLAIEKERFESASAGGLPELVEWIKQQPSRKGLIENAANSGGTVYDFDLKRLDGLERLNTVFGADSKQMRAILGSDQKTEVGHLSELADYIEGKMALPNYEEGVSYNMAPTTFEQRKALVEKRIASAASAQELWSTLDAAHIDNVYSLELVFGENSPEMKRILELEKVYPDVTSEIATFLDSQPEALDFVRDFIRTDISSPEQAASLHQLYDLNRVLAADPVLLTKLVDLQKQGIDFEGLQKFVQPDPEVRAEILRRLITEGAQGKDLQLSRLLAIGELEKALGKDSAEYKLIRENEKSLDIASLANFVSRNPDGPLFLRQAANEPDPAVHLNPDRLNALVSIHAIYSEPVFQDRMAKVLAAERKGAQLTDIARYIDRGQWSLDLFSRLLDADTPIVQFSYSQLLLREILANSDGIEAVQAEKILDFSAKSGSRNIAEYITEEPEQWRARIRQVEKYIDADISPVGLDSQALRFLTEFERTEIPNSGRLLPRVAELARQGLPLREMVRFIQENPPVNGKIFYDKVESGAKPDQFKLAALRDIVDLDVLDARYKLSPEVMTYVRKMHEQGLSASRVLNYVAEKPADRVLVLDRLAKENADLKRFKAQMDLELFPDKIASQLADGAANGGMSVARILSNLRHWQAGRGFYERVVDRAVAGGDLSQASLDTLMTQSRSTLAPDAQTGRRVPSVPADGFTKVAKDAVASIEAAIPRDQPIVVLGRDMVSILPLLQSRRPNVQYFLFSRLHEVSEGSTARQWLKEVPPNAAVIDTGYSGSIISLIHGFDPSVKGYLLSTSGTAYPRLLASESHHSMATQVEELTKLIGRSSRYTESGGAVSRLQERESQDVTRHRPAAGSKDRWIFGRESRNRYRAMGLSEWDAWRYTQFTGLTPQDRLNLNTPGEVDLHYKHVQYLRDRIKAETAPVKAVAAPTEAGAASVETVAAPLEPAAAPVVKVPNIQMSTVTDFTPAPTEPAESKLITGPLHSPEWMKPPMPPADKVVSPGQGNAVAADVSGSISTP